MRNADSAGPAERRQQPYTEAIVAAVAAEAAGEAGAITLTTAALETAAGLISRALMVAEVSPGGPLTAGLTPPVLGQIGRDLIRRGESLWRISVADGKARLSQAGSWDVRGGPDEGMWDYRLDEFGPSGNATVPAPSAAVLHFRYAVDPARPWQGVGPLQWAAATARLHGGLETALGDEAATARANLIPVPAAGDDAQLDQLRLDFKAARGRAVFAETTAAGWGEGAIAAPQSDWQPRRVGANPPQPLVGLRDSAALSVLAACGVPVELVSTQGAGAEREAYRRFLFSTVAPLGRLIAAEAAAKLDTDVRLDFREIMAADVTGRSRAYATLKNAGMTPRRAEMIVGFRPGGDANGGGGDQ